MRNKEITPGMFVPTTHSGIDPFGPTGLYSFPKHSFWLKNEFSGENKFCPIKWLKDKESIFYPEESKPILDKNDVIIGEYWLDGDCWCFSLFTEYEYLSV